MVDTSLDRGAYFRGMPGSILSREHTVAGSRFNRWLAANADTAARGTFGVGGVLAWLAVGVPFLIGFYIAIDKAVALF